MSSHAVRDLTPPMPSAGPVYRLAAGTAFGIMGLQRWEFDVTGLGHVPTTSGAIIAANHTSFWDFFTVGRPCWFELDRPIRILAKESLFRTPVFGWMMRQAKHIPVHRASGGDALRSAVAALQARELVLVLPEQTISTSFDLLGFKTGASRMAIAAGVPLVPSVSWGTQRFHTVGRRPTPRWRLPVRIAYGPALHPQPDDDPVEVTAELRRRMQVLLDEAIETYADHGIAAGAWWHPARLGGGAPPHAAAEQEIERLRDQWRQTG